MPCISNGILVLCIEYFLAATSKRPGRSSSREEAKQQRQQKQKQQQKQRSWPRRLSTGLSTLRSLIENGLQAAHALEPENETKPISKSKSQPIQKPSDSRVFAFCFDLISVSISLIFFNCVVSCVCVVH